MTVASRTSRLLLEQSRTSRNLEFWHKVPRNYVQTVQFLPNSTWNNPEFEEQVWFSLQESHDKRFSKEKLTADFSCKKWNPKYDQETILLWNYGQENGWKQWEQFGQTQYNQSPSFVATRIS